jgi:hypothetical protein
MKKIIKFENFQNEELFHGYAGKGSGESGVSWLNGVFSWLGDKMGFEVDILQRYLKHKVDEGDIQDSQAEEISKKLLTRVGGKSREEIEQMVESEIGSHSDAFEQEF